MPAQGVQERGDTLQMPTASTNSTRSARKGAKSTSRKAASRRAGSTVRAHKTTRKVSAAKSKRAKAARARAASQTRAAVRQAETASRLTVTERSGALGDYA